MHKYLKKGWISVLLGIGFAVAGLLAREKSMIIFYISEIAAITCFIVMIYFGFKLHKVEKIEEQKKPKEPAVAVIDIE